ncbi:SDR family oxidoreductase [Rhodoferax sp.]|uniref:SDR family oxidoreductase n=1 Tax=Rhodoferax sp. TaxID=50421 RepID=UPI0026031A6A|nr:SDR family oxidoreductase [Rhodoferax sp.]MDD3935251.1 SDR family oxidoreductase [Rhodoferax sp.]
MKFSSLQQLEGQVAVVTGGASGIGESTSRLFAAEGAAVVVADINAERGERLVADLLAIGARAIFVRTDVTCEDDVARAVQNAVAHFGRLDIMVNNAGVVGAIGSLLHTDASDWKATLSILLDSVFFGIKHAARQMVAQRSGVILSLSSIAGVMGGQGPHAYTAAKHGVVGLTVSAASEFSPYGIRINAVAPAVTVTPMIELVRGSRAAALDYAAAISPLGSAQMPEEIAQTLLFLAGPGAAHITAQTLIIDSGVTRTSAVANDKYHSRPNSFVGPKLAPV